MTMRDESKAWDVRTLERKLRRGSITQKDYEKHLKGLPDSTDKVAQNDDEGTNGQSDA